MEAAIFFIDFIANLLNSRWIFSLFAGKNSIFFQFRNAHGIQIYSINKYIQFQSMVSLMQNKMLHEPLIL